MVAEREENTHKRQIRLGRALSKGAATLTAVMLVVGGYLGYGQVRSIMDADSGAVMEGELTGFETASGPMDEPLPPPPEGVPASVQLVVFDAQGLASAPIPIGIRTIVSPGTRVTELSLIGLPDKARLSAGTDQGGGAWALTAADLDNLTLTVPDTYAGELDLTVVAEAKAPESGNTASATGSLRVRISPAR
ncbi:MAG: hypothetical protein KDE22_15260 [Rhodobacterales bacterium]|nr:hypothetical protein [Rhodobacterales bacterium]